MYCDLEIDPGLFAEARKVKCPIVGEYADMAHSPTLTEFLKGIYGRDNLCLKYFIPKGAPREHRWSGGKLKHIMRVQNIFAWHGLSPRAYDLVLLNGKYPAQVTDWVEWSDPKPRAKAVMQVISRYGIWRVDRKPLNLKHSAAKPINYVGDQFVDFGRYAIGKTAKKLLWKRVARKKGNKGYQGVEEFGIKGVRHTGRRVAKLKLDETDFEGKTVLDIGCNEGAFMREAVRRGAKRVVGIDQRDAQTAYEVNNWLGYWNTDAYNLRVPKHVHLIEAMSGIKQFDIVFCLAMARHVGGFASWIADLCKETLFWEGHTAEPRGKYEQALLAAFDEAEWLGRVYDDHKKGRPLWRCVKNDSQPDDRREIVEPSGEGEELPFSEEPRAGEDIRGEIW